MHRHTFQIAGKIAILSVITIIVAQVGIYVIGASQTQTNAYKNELIYASANSQNLSEVGVALGTGIAVRFDTEAYEEVIMYGEVGEIGKTAEESRKIRLEMIAQNMTIIKEYLAILKTNPIELLKSSENRRNTLNTFISQLELRYKNASLSQVNLENQKELLLSDIRQIEAGIDEVKNKMSTNFTSNNASGTVENVDEYLDLRRRYNQNFTDIVFINQFMVQYNFLNNYNKKLLDTLINNREAIINEGYIVIPDSGDEFLREFKLLYEEKEFKEITQ